MLSMRSVAGSDKFVFYNYFTPAPAYGHGQTLRQRSRVGMTRKCDNVIAVQLSYHPRVSGLAMAGGRCGGDCL
jgi:hypothetical protein